MSRLVVDTGFLVALYVKGDHLHQAALSFVAANRAALITVVPVIVEASFFLSPRAKIELIKWVSRGGIGVVDIPTADYPALCHTIEAYADRDIDLADAALIWLANRSGERRILTVDAQDFSVFRLKGGRRFDLLPWMPTP